MRVTMQKMKEMERKREARGRKRTLEIMSGN